MLNVLFLNGLIWYKNEPSKGFQKGLKALKPKKKANICRNQLGRVFFVYIEFLSSSSFGTGHDFKPTLQKGTSFFYNKKKNN